MILLNPFALVDVFSIFPVNLFFDDILLSFQKLTDIINQFVSWSSLKDIFIFILCNFQLKQFNSLLFMLIDSSHLNGFLAMNHSKIILVIMLTRIIQCFTQTIFIIFLFFVINFTVCLLYSKELRFALLISKFACFF